MAPVPLPAPRRIGTAHVDKSLDLVGKLYQRSIHPSVRVVADGGRLAAPLVVDLDPTTLCDLACPECISSGVLHTGQFRGDRITALAGELVAAGVRAVILIGGGEPLMHRAIGAVIRTLHDGGVQLGLVTNGTLIGRYLDEIAGMVSWVRVSLDAATAPTYDRFRPSRRRTSVFPLVIDNMRRLAERKAGRLGYSFLLMQRFAEDGSVTDTNYDEVYEAGALAKDIGCDYFEMKAMLDADHFTVNQRAEDIELVERQLEKLRDLEDDSFRLLGSSNWAAVRAGDDPVQPKGYRTCATAELRTTITPNGVYVCPYHRGNERGRIGDLADQPFDRMWAAADTTVIDPSADCRFVCARHPTNLAVADLGDAGVVDDFDPFI
ncbi:radical SAM protein [Actinokineospora sp. UTMC 2448]|uniref:radical SAM protein n=1 Tax=Actinokineospora sp. UTMC 2448 TaxID=2268449 RepID=UPI002164319E|nr:radical SAM protein [Actinokineospora sp. UTMC 2448]UVS82502.1 molybdenum cofactor biosynthesis protein A [Actinokineospora sp. UTMC 2448]